MHKCSTHDIKAMVCYCNQKRGNGWLFGVDVEYQFKFNRKRRKTKAIYSIEAAKDRKVELTIEEIK